MKTGKLSILLAVFIMATIAVSACTPSRISVEEYDQVQSPAETAEAEPVEEAVVPDTSEEQEPEPVATEEKDPLADFPIMDGGYQVQISRSGENITFQVDGTIEDVVTYYQAELPNYAWEMAGPPDNAVANIATMLRENADGDRLAINMQFNELGNFVILTVTISRAN